MRCWTEVNTAKASTVNGDSDVAVPGHQTRPSVRRGLVGVRTVSWDCAWFISDLISIVVSLIDWERPRSRGRGKARLGADTGVLFRRARQAERCRCRSGRYGEPQKWGDLAEIDILTIEHG